MNEINKHIKQIRKWIHINDLDAFIIPHDDEYLSEYIPPENERLAWGSGFTGSAGAAIIKKDDATIFVDGRYTVQVKQQVDDKIYEICHLANTPLIKWMKNNLKKESRLGYDPRLHRVNWVQSMSKILKNQVHLIPMHENPTDIHWENRPKPSHDKALLLNLKYAGLSSEKKRINMSNIITKNKCDAAFLTKLDSIAWVLNIRGNDVPCNPVLLSHGLMHANGAFDLFINESKIPEGFHDHVGKNVNVHPSKNIKNHYISIGFDSFVANLAYSDSPMVSQPFPILLSIFNTLS
mgnify:CR=1 FL=1